MLVLSLYKPLPGAYIIYNKYNLQAKSGEKSGREAEGRIQENR